MPSYAEWAVNTSREKARRGGKQEACTVPEQGLGGSFLPTVARAVAAGSAVAAGHSWSAASLPGPPCSSLPENHPDLGRLWVLSVSINNPP